jgi:hypothetical protein
MDVCWFRVTNNNTSVLSPTQKRPQIWIVGKTGVLQRFSPEISSSGLAE